MSSYGMGDTLHVFPLWIIKVKPRGLSVPSKAMMVFQIHHYVHFHGFYLSLNSVWLKSRSKVNKHSDIIICLNIEFALLPIISHVPV